MGDNRVVRSCEPHEFLGRFFRRQRLGRADDALGGGVVAGFVDRFDHRQ
jgi:hypothetical protein